MGPFLSQVGDPDGIPIGFNPVLGAPVLVGLHDMQESLSIIGPAPAGLATQTRLAEGWASRTYHPQVQVGIRSRTLPEGWASLPDQDTLRRDGALDPLSHVPTQGEAPEWVAVTAGEILAHAFPHLLDAADAAVALTCGQERGARAILPALRSAPEVGELDTSILTEITQTTRSIPELRCWIGTEEGVSEWGIPDGCTFVSLADLIGGGRLRTSSGVDDDIVPLTPDRRLVESTYLALVLAVGRRLRAWCDKPTCPWPPGGLHLHDPIGLDEMRAGRAGWTTSGRFLTPVTITTDHPDVWAKFGPRTDRSILIGGCSGEDELLALHGLAASLQPPTSQGGRVVYHGSVRGRAGDSQERPVPVDPETGFARSFLEIIEDEAGVASPAGS